MWLHKWQILLWELPLGLLHFQVIITILSIYSFLPNLFLYFLTSKSEQFLAFLYVFILVLNFSKAWEFCQCLFSMFARSLLNFSPISLSLSSSLIKFFKPASESSSADTLLVPKILFRLPASSLSSLTWKLTLSSCSCSDSTPDPFWHFFLSSALTLEELTLIFCFVFLCLTCFSRSRPDSDYGSELPLSSFDYLPFPFSLDSGRTFFDYFTSQSWKLLFRHNWISGCCCRFFFLLARACFFIDKVYGRKWL